MHPVELALRIPFCMIGIADMLDLAPGNEHIVEIGHRIEFVADRGERPVIRIGVGLSIGLARDDGHAGSRSEEHTSELQSLMRISYAVFCLKNKIKQSNKTTTYTRLDMNTRTKQNN